MVKVLESYKDYQLLKHENGFYAVDKNNNSVGYSLIFSQDREEVYKYWENIIN